VVNKEEGVKVEQTVESLPGAGGRL